MDKNLTISSGDLRLYKVADVNVMVLILFAEVVDNMHNFTGFIGWWWVLGNTGDGFKRYLVPSNKLYNLVSKK